MRVLYDNYIFIAQNFGGVPRYFFELMNYYHKNKSLEFEFPITYSINEYIQDCDFAPWVRFFRNSPFEKIGEIRKYLRKSNVFLLNKALKQQKYDIFHPTYYDEYYLDYIKDKKLVITIHDMIHEIYPEYFQNDLYKSAEYKKLLAYRADKIIAVSENTKKDILRFYPDIDENKIDVVYHGSLFMKAPENTGTLKLPEKYILYVGNRNIYKNFIPFIKSIAPLLKSEKLTLIAAGSADFNEEELNLFKEQNITDKLIHIRATDEELAILYKNALFFVFSSQYEGFGIPLLEAFSLGCPVISSNKSSLPEIGADACLYFDPDSEESMYESVKGLINNSEKREDLRQKGFERIKYFSWEKAAQQTQKVYESILL